MKQLFQKSVDNELKATLITLIEEELIMVASTPPPASSSPSAWVSFRNSIADLFLPEPSNGLRQIPDAEFKAAERPLGERLAAFASGFHKAGTSSEYVDLDALAWNVVGLPVDRYLDPEKSPIALPAVIAKTEISPPIMGAPLGLAMATPPSPADLIAILSTIDATIKLLTPMAASNVELRAALTTMQDLSFSFNSTLGQTIKHDPKYGQLLHALLGKELPALSALLQRTKNAANQGTPVSAEQIKVSLNVFARSFQLFQSAVTQCASMIERTSGLSKSLYASARAALIAVGNMRTSSGWSPPLVAGLHDFLDGPLCTDKGLQQPSAIISALNRQLNFSSTAGEGKFTRAAMAAWKPLSGAGREVLNTGRRAWSGTTTVVNSQWNALPPIGKGVLIGGAVLALVGGTVWYLWNDEK